MALILHYHPLASFCHKVLIALHERDIAFTASLVDLGDPGSGGKLLALWPVGKIPVLEDRARGEVIPETSIIIEYLERHYGGARPMLPHDADARLEVRLWDRFHDLYVHAPMQKIVTDRLRAADEKDARGVADARAGLQLAYGMIERRMAERTWAAGDDFSMADCAAAPALFYAAIVEPFPAAHAHLAAYFERLMARPSIQRVVAEARPWFHLFPFHADIPARFR